MDKLKKIWEIIVMLLLVAGTVLAWFSGMVLIVALYATLVAISIGVPAAFIIWLFRHL
jgi:hypothetical protein